MLYSIGLDYLIIHRVGCIFVRCPFHDTWLTMIAFKCQSALISSERHKVISLWLILIMYPIAETTCASGHDLATLSAHTGKYLYFLFKSNKKKNPYKLITLFNPKIFLNYVCFHTSFVSQGCLDKGTFRFFT